MHSATIFIALAAVVASASASLIAADIVARPAYRTTYGVSDVLTGDHKSATEVRDGGVTKGSYSLLQPDGVVRTVNYIVTPLGGFQAQVINKGVAGHPAVLGVGKGIALAAPALTVVGPVLGARSVVNGLSLATPLNALGLGWGAGLGLGGWGLLG